MGDSVYLLLMRFLHYDEGVGVDGHDQLLQLRNLLLFHSGQHHLGRLMAVGAFPIEEGCASVQLGADGLRHRVVLLGNDQRHLGIVEPVHHGIQHLARNKHRHAGIQRLGDVLEHDARQDGHPGVKAHGNLSDGDIPVFELQQPHHDVRAAGGGAANEHHAQPQPADHAAVKGAEQRIHGRHRDFGKSVDQDRAENHSQQTAAKEPSADLHTAEDEQRQVNKDRQHAHAAVAQQLHGHQRKAGNTAGADLIGL